MSTLPLCVRIDANDLRSAAALVGDDWREVETLETHERENFPLNQDARGVPFRFAVDDDLNDCRRIASESFSHDRLHVDKSVGKKAADLAKIEWIERAFKGDADKIFVVESEEEVVAFLICKKSDGVAVIDLIAVDINYRRRGIASALIRAAIWHYGSPMRVGTQSLNKPSLRLYAKLGFKPVLRRRTFHK